MCDGIVNLIIRENLFSDTVSCNQKNTYFQGGNEQ